MSGLRPQPQRCALRLPVNGESGAFTAPCSSLLTHLCSGLLLSLAHPAVLPPEVLSTQISFLLPLFFFHVCQTNIAICLLVLLLPLSCPGVSTNKYLVGLTPCWCPPLRGSTLASLVWPLHQGPCSFLSHRSLTLSSAPGLPIPVAGFCQFVFSISAPGPQSFTLTGKIVQPQKVKETNTEGSRHDRNIVPPMCKCGPTVPSWTAVFQNTECFEL